MEDVTTQVRDPVCGMIIDMDKAEAERDFEGTRYWFCSEVCLMEFERDPEAYVNPVDEG